MLFFGLLLMAFGLWSWYQYTNNPAQFKNKKTGEILPARIMKITSGSAGFVGFILMVASLGNSEPSDAEVKVNKATAVATDRTKKMPQRIQALDSRIRSVIMQTESVPEIDIGPVDGLSDSQAYGALVMHSGDILKDMREKMPDADFKTVRFVGSMQLVDQYNNKSTGRVAGLDFDYAEVKKFNFEGGATQQKLLRFAKPKFYSPIGQDIYKAWCSSDLNVRLSQNFCGRA